ncbi:Ribosomal protein lysine methyltransferase [Sporothrix curviconia]|uniref:Ribosomal protein lysine methyltransferase n=1 Tax=Sporothrix curviconia TaxID=1260050 RepID=A0ABP0C3Y2_9PEZI
MSASPLGRLLARLGPEVDDVDKETFLLFAHDRPEAQNLGFLDPHAAVLELTVAGRDLTIHQSPGVLNSNRPGGTTGAVLWKVTPAVAEWLARSDNVFFAGAGADSSAASSSVLGPDSAVLELGCGISGVIGLALAGKATKASPPGPPPKKRPKGKMMSATAPAGPLYTNTVGRYVLTDQPYVAKFLQRNLDENGPSGAAGAGSSGRLSFCPLDWEQDAVRPGDHRLLGGGDRTSFDAVLACDCIYNEALVAPLVQTCVDVCRLRAAEAEEGEKSSSSSMDKAVPALCIVGQQLRDPDVLSAWLTAFAASFRVWRVPEELLTPSLWLEAGFVVHVGILKEAEI